MGNYFIFLVVMSVLPLQALAQFSGPSSLNKGKVKLTVILSQDAVHTGSTVSALAIAEIDRGWHINSPAPADENLIPTSLHIEKNDVLDSVDISFPSGHEVKFDFAEIPIEVYDGTLMIALRLAVATILKPGTYALPVSLRYQACSDNICLAPTSVTTTMALTVVPASTPVKQINSSLFGGASKQADPIH